MILIVAEPFDTAALWLRAAMAGATRMRVRAVTPSQLAYAPSAIHRLSTTDADIAFTLGDGTSLRGADLSGCINRMTAIPQAHLARAAAADRNYALGELHAFTLGWLATLPCPLLNPPAPESLAGPFHSEMAARHFAVHAGLACAPAAIAPGDALDPPPRRPGTDMHFVIDGQAIGALLPIAQREAMIQFAALWGGRMVQIETRADDGARHFVSATSLIDFPRGGAALVRAMLRALAA